MERASQGVEMSAARVTYRLDSGQAVEVKVEREAESPDALDDLVHRAEALFDHALAQVKQASRGEATPTADPLPG